MGSFCYLCAYKKADRPRRQDRLPTGSIAPADVTPLGTCAICSVFACSLHGTRYRLLQCAICTPAQAVLAAFNHGGDEVSAELARGSAYLAWINLTRVQEGIDELQSNDGREAVIVRLIEHAPSSQWLERGPMFGLPDDDPRAVAAAIRSAFSQEQLTLREDAAVSPQR